MQSNVTNKEARGQTQKGHATEIQVVANPA
jgi:hypothetical protein